MRIVRSAAVVLAVVALSTVAGCGGADGSADASGPRAVALALAHSLTGDHGARACALLAPETRSELQQSAGTPCARAILEEDLPDPGAVRRVSVFGTMAQVRFVEGDVWFLTEYRTGWRVLAAGCAPEPGRPYNCQLQGG